MCTLVFVRGRKSGVDYITRYYEKMIQEKITVSMRARALSGDRYRRTGCQEFDLATLVNLIPYIP